MFPLAAATIATFSLLAISQAQSPNTLQDAIPAPIPGLQVVAFPSTSPDPLPQPQDAGPQYAYPPNFNSSSCSRDPSQTPDCIFLSAANGKDNRIPGSPDSISLPSYHTPAGAATCYTSLLTRKPTQDSVIDAVYVRTPASTKGWEYRLAFTMLRRWSPPKAKQLGFFLCINFKQPVASDWFAESVVLDRSMGKEFTIAGFQLAKMPDWRDKGGVEVVGEVKLGDGMTVRTAGNGSLRLMDIA